MFFNNNDMKLQVNNRRKFGKSAHMWKLNNTLLNKKQVKEESVREIRIYFEMNEKENMPKFMRYHKSSTQR